MTDVQQPWLAGKIRTAADATPCETEHTSAPAERLHRQLEARTAPRGPLGEEVRAYVRQVAAELVRGGGGKPSEALREARRWDIYSRVLAASESFYGGRPEDAETACRRAKRWADAAIAAYYGDPGPGAAGPDLTGCDGGD